MCAYLSYARHALETVGPATNGADWKVVPDNFRVEVRAPGITLAAVEAAIEALRSAEFWADGGFWADVVGALPSYRLSKFQPLMPPAVEREVIGKYLLDVAGAERWLRAQQWPAARQGSGSA